MTPLLVELRLIDLTDARWSEAEACLLPAEVERAARLVHEADRRRFRAARAALRLALAEATGREPGRLEFELGPRGKPSLAGAPSVHFNLSHSGEVAMLAIADRPVGVDVEHEKPLDFNGVARAVFSEHERAALVAAADTRAAFFRGWTRKEAFVKLLGDGLSAPLADFDVSLDADPGEALLAVRLDTRGPCSVRALPAPSGYTAAIALAATDLELRLRD